MSGGFFNYKDRSLLYEMFSEVDDRDPKIPNVLEDREISELTYDLLRLIHDFDWYRCGDTGKESYLKSKYEFKKKWFSNRGVRIKRVIDTAIEELKQELYETYVPKNVEEHEYKNAQHLSLPRTSSNPPMPNVTPPKPEK